jgi:predicted transposase/invertase (TIGR01784 family)
MYKYDSSYKKLFSNREIIIDLLTGFVKEDWVNNLNFDSLELVNSSFVSDNLKQRHSDIIWRVRQHNDWLYIYLLIEFQSTIDYFMSVRIMTYIGLLYQHLIDSQKLKKDDKLPGRCNVI